VLSDLNPPFCQNLNDPGSLFLTTGTFEEVGGYIRKLKNSKSTAVDVVDSDILKKYSDRFSVYIAKMINFTFISGTIPAALKVAKVIPIFKKGDRNNPSNYRPISILTPSSKILEKAMKKRLPSYLDHIKFLSPQQYGFRKGRGVEPAVVDIVSKVQISLDERDVSLGLFVHIRKAFDFVNDCILLRKIERLGVRGVVIK